MPKSGEQIFNMVHGSNLCTDTHHDYATGHTNLGDIGKYDHKQPHNSQVVPRAINTQYHH